MLGENVEVSVSGDKMTITVDISKEGTVSKSGKSKVIASTKGNKKVETERGDVMIGLNVYTSI